MVNTPHRAPLPVQGQGFSGATGNKPKAWDEGINWFKFTPHRWVTIRFYGPVYVIATSWIESVRAKKRFPLLCEAYNQETGLYDYDKSPLLKELDVFNSEDERLKAVRPRKSGLVHGIVRQMQKQPNAADPSWRPWQPMRIPLSVMGTLAKLKDLNVHVIEGNEYHVDVNDPYWGMDISIMYDPNGAPTDKYTIQAGQHTPLNEQEQTYLSEMYDWQKLVQYPSYEEVKRKLVENNYYKQENASLPSMDQFNRDGQMMSGMLDAVHGQAPQPPQSYMPQPQPSGGFSQHTADEPSFAQAPAMQPLQNPVTGQFTPPPAVDHTGMPSMASPFPSAPGAPEPQVEMPQVPNAADLPAAPGIAKQGGPLQESEIPFAPNPSNVKKN